MFDLHAVSRFQRFGARLGGAQPGPLPHPARARPQGLRLAQVAVCALGAFAGLCVASAQGLGPAGAGSPPPQGRDVPAPPWGQQAPAPSTQAEFDPPSRVGRLAEVLGRAWLYEPEQRQWEAAELNRPFAQGDRLATDVGGRAVVRVGSTVIRLDGQSELEAVTLSDESTELRLHEGRMALTVVDADLARGVQLLTPQGRVSIRKPGRYRLDLRRPMSQFSTYTGEALVQAAGVAVTVWRGQRADYWQDEAGRGQYALTLPLDDAFANWVRRGDDVQARRVASSYASDEMTGVEDLDQHGRWEQDSIYGALWTPHHVEVGWRPYSRGRWVWARHWGWTWVDMAPWGFAPFHYGRWVWHRSRWCWTPGRYHRRPVYAPALVAWVGAPGVSLSIHLGGGRGHGGAVGWFPLGPDDVYVPSFRTNVRYVERVNTHQVRKMPDLASIMRGSDVAAPGRRYSHYENPEAWTVLNQEALVQRVDVAQAERQWQQTEEGQRWAREAKPSAWSLLNGAPARVGPGTSLASPSHSLRATPEPDPAGKNRPLGAGTGWSRTEKAPLEASPEPLAPVVAPPAPPLPPSERVSSEGLWGAGGRPRMETMPVPRQEGGQQGLPQAPQPPQPSRAEPTPAPAAPLPGGQGWGRAQSDEEPRAWRRERRESPQPIDEGRWERRQLPQPAPEEALPRPVQPPEPAPATPRPSHRSSGWGGFFDGDSGRPRAMPSPAPSPTPAAPATRAQEERRDNGERPEGKGRRLEIWR
jgi:hypothetical protein